MERVLDSLGYTGRDEGHAASGPDRLFYRNELREYPLAELRKAPGPMAARELAVILCQTEAKTGRIAGRNMDPR